MSIIRVPPTTFRVVRIAVSKTKALTAGRQKNTTPSQIVVEPCPKHASSVPRFPSPYLGSATMKESIGGLRHSSISILSLHLRSKVHAEATRGAPRREFRSLARIRFHLILGSLLLPHCAHQAFRNSAQQFLAGPTGIRGYRTVPSRFSAPRHTLRY